MALGVLALLAERRLRGGSAPTRYGRAAGDVATLGLTFISGVYLYIVCYVVGYEFYTSGMAEQEGHAVDRAWVALRLALRAAGCAALVALMLRGIAEHYGYYRLRRLLWCVKGNPLRPYPTTPWRIRQAPPS